MSRPSSQCRLNLERLEAREAMAAGGPSAQAQYMLELINQARTTPSAAAERVTTNLSKDVQNTLEYYGVDPSSARREIAGMPARQPLAWNGELAAAAQKQSQDQANTGVQSHTGADGSNLDTRLDRVGYDDRTVSAENAYAYAESVDHAMQAFLIDWGVPGKGHLHNLLQPNASGEQIYREVGVGIVKTSNNDLGPLVVTQNFGRQDDSKPYILGVAYNDKNGDNFYNPGEGAGDVAVQVTNVDNGKSQTVPTWDAGGYQVQVDPGDYKVTAKVGNQVVDSKNVVVGSDNTKVDFLLNKPWQGPAPTAPVAASTPATPPAPVTPPAPPAPRQTQVTPTLLAVETPTLSAQSGRQLNVNLNASPAIAGTTSIQAPPPTIVPESAVMPGALPLLTSNNGAPRLGFITNWKAFRARSNG